MTDENVCRFILAFYLCFNCGKIHIRFILVFIFSLKIPENIEQKEHSRTPMPSVQLFPCCDYNCNCRTVQAYTSGFVCIWTCHGTEKSRYLPGDTLECFMTPGGLRHDKSGLYLTDSPQRGILGFSQGHSGTTLLLRESASLHCKGCIVREPLPFASTECKFLRNKATLKSREEKAGLDRA